jgi:hypothetical protein
MTILVGLRHLRRNRCDRPVSLGPQMVRLSRRPHSRTRIASSALNVKPARSRTGTHGNWHSRFVFPGKADADLINPFHLFGEPYVENLPFEFPPELQKRPCGRVKPAQEACFSGAVLIAD